MHGHSRYGMITSTLSFCFRTFATLFGVALPISVQSPDATEYSSICKYILYDLHHSLFQSIIQISSPDEETSLRRSLCWISSRIQLPQISRSIRLRNSRGNWKRTNIGLVFLSYSNCAHASQALAGGPFKDGQIKQGIT